MISTVMEELLASHPIEKLKDGSVVKGVITENHMKVLPPKANSCYHPGQQPVNTLPTHTHFTHVWRLSIPSTLHSDSQREAIGPRRAHHSFLG